MKTLQNVIPLIIVIIFSVYFYNEFKVNNSVKSINPGKEYPNDWFLTQRLFPQEEIPFDLYKKELKKISSLKKKLYKQNGNWEFAGPTNIGGRITDVEMSHNSYDTIYAGCASGGILKSVDGGESWISIFDDALSLSIGDIAVDPVNPSIIYAGTGEVNAGGGSTTYDGMGIFKSTDAGLTWRHLGLEDTRYISRIVIDPLNHNIIYAGAMGKLYAENDERGVYKSEDGGETWSNVKFISGKTGCIDLAINPENPEIIYAAMWERLREPHNRKYGGAECGIYKSTDGGKKWTELITGLPSNSENVGRIGISISQFNPEILYAVYADDVGFFSGVYKTDNGGNSWLLTQGSPPSTIFSSFGWWFGNIRVSPENPNIVYVLGLQVYKTIDGGINWAEVSSQVHVDQHGMYIHPNDKNFIILGNDGGIFKSEDGAQNWSKAYGLPITQFYTCEIDYQNPERLYGGSQDNSTMRTLTGQLDDWEIITGGDGFYVLVDPNDNNFIYSEYQYGVLFRSTDGGNNFTSARNGIIFSDLTNWNTPVVFNPQNSASLFYGSNRVYKSTDRAKTWNPISPFLTDTHQGNLDFGTVTTIAAAPSDSNYIYAGTDDGNVWVTKNNGANWNKISETLPLRWITRVAVDPYEKNTVYVTLSGFKFDDYLPHIFKSTDAGNNWFDISGNLPEVPLNDVIIDSGNTSTLYVASDAGVFYTLDNQNWNLLGNDLPNVPITDIALHQPTRTLVAATFGRSMWKYDLKQLTTIDENQNLKNEFLLSQNYPNPFNPGTKIKFVIPKGANNATRITVYDILGNEIKTLVNGIKHAGTYEIEFNGNDLASGIYIVKMISGKFSSSKKMLLLK